MILSALLTKLLITFNLSLTLAPPKIATYGLAGLSIALEIFLISFSTKKPMHDSAILAAIPAFEAWARWAVPNASLTNTSPKLAHSLANSGLFLDSFLTTSLLALTSIYF